MSHLTHLKSKVKTLDALLEQTKQWQSEGQNVVFTNGCFDILHRGHVEYLAQAADLGNKLVLGLNTDDSVRRQNKSPERPINNEEARATVLAALAFIDALVFFDDDTPLDLIKKVGPDTLVKGGDYDPNETDRTAKQYIVGSDLVKANGGIVAIIGLVPDFSTTATIEKLRK
jgi:rfaE bifunctional protein nucleotidyltransferase chain/domain